VIADLKPYAVYKESGLPWLGSVPEHWELIPNRGLVRKRKVLVGKHHSDYRLLSLTKQGVIVRDISTGKGKFSADMGSSQEVRNGDIVFCLFDVPETPRTVGLSRYDGMITGAYTVFESLGKGSREYFELFYRAMDDRKLLSPIYSGLRNTIPPERFLGTKTPQPPRDEQAAIVRFLDWANGRLERAIRAKRKVIVLLNEQKQAIIHRAVTRGLDPSVPLKPSGIPWFGDIPQHWEVRRLRHLIKGRLTYGANAAAKFTNPDWPRYIRITDFRADGSLRADTFRSLPPSIACDYMVLPGDILFARSGATVGKAFLVVALTGVACHAGYLIRARANRNLVSPEFLFAFTQSKAFSAWKDSTFNTATIQNIGADKYANLAVPFPSLAEQQSILDSLTGEIQPLFTAISRLEREIELLREYRTRLVADVVTGKLDVREAAAGLPEAVAEPDGSIEVESDALDLEDGELIEEGQAAR
jgi:type I restriction enzyme S subunit